MPQEPSIAPMRFADYLNTLRYNIGSHIAPFLGIDFDEMSRRAAAGQLQQMVIPFGPRLPKTIEEVLPLLRNELTRTGHLGFDTANQAISAIRQHPDWATRWDVRGEPTLENLGNLYRNLVQNQINLERAGLAPQRYAPEPSPFQTVLDMARSAPQPQTPAPTLPSNVIPFPKR